MKRKKKFYFYLAGGVLAVLVLAALVHLSGGKEVETVEARLGSITKTVEDTGYVQPVTSCDLHAAQNARVVQVPVETGQKVEKGQTLVVLENLDLAVQISETRSQLSQAGTAVESARAALESARLALEDAEDNFSRVEELYQAGAATRVEYDQARLQLETCRQNVDAQTSSLEGALTREAGLRQTLEKLCAKERQLVVKSPLDGVVLDLPVDEEQVVGPGALVASVAVPGRLEVRAEILSDDMAEVKVGQKAVITAPVLGQKTLAGEVKQIYPRAEEKRSALGVIQRRVPVIIALEDPANLKPGYEVTVAIETLKKEGVLVVPREAVRANNEGGGEVMVVADGRVRHRAVQTGIGDRENIEITGGLAAGDKIIRDGSLNLPENSRVKAVVK